MFKQAIFLVFSFSMLVATARAEPLRVEDWLMKMEQSANQLSFSGSFVYLHNQQISAMRVARKIVDGTVQERLYALNGEPQEVVRNDYQTSRYASNSNIMIRDQRLTSIRHLPTVLDNNLDELKAIYQFTDVGSGRVANRVVKKINIKPLDSYRYGYQLSIDEQSGLLLRSDLIDTTGDVIEQYMFVDIYIGDDIPEEDLQSVFDKNKVSNNESSGEEVMSVDHVDNSMWFIKSVPSGFNLSRHLRRKFARSDKIMEHMVFTDGLATVSIFIKKSDGIKKSLGHMGDMLSINLYRAEIDGFDVTVMGEVPVTTVQFFAENLRSN